MLKSIGKLKVRPSRTFAKDPAKARPTNLPGTEAPHPGMSYNPSFKDHQDLLKQIVDREQTLMREEAHLERVTSSMFSSISPAENEVSSAKNNICKSLFTLRHKMPEQQSRPVGITCNTRNTKQYCGKFGCFIWHRAKVKASPHFS